MLWGDLAEAAGGHGLATLHPSSPDVGVAGYSLGGGIGWYARRLGLQCNAVTAVELVLADGTFVRATADYRARAVLGPARRRARRWVSSPRWSARCSPLETVVAGYLAWDWTAVEQVLPGVGRLVRATRRTR